MLVVFGEYEELCCQSLPIFVKKAAKNSKATTPAAFTEEISSNAEEKQIFYL